jgi:hypothetical protein
LIEGKNATVCKLEIRKSAAPMSIVDKPKSAVNGPVSDCQEPTLQVVDCTNVNESEQITQLVDAYPCVNVPKCPRKAKIANEICWRIWKIWPDGHAAAVMNVVPGKVKHRRKGQLKISHSQTRESNSPKSKQNWKTAHNTRQQWLSKMIEKAGGQFS